MSKLPNCKNNRHSITPDALECLCGQLVRREAGLSERNRRTHNNAHAEIRGIIELTPQNTTFTQEMIDGYYERIVEWKTK